MLGKIALLHRFDPQCLQSVVNDIADELEVGVASLYGSGQHWFSHEFELETTEDENLWLAHSLSLLKTFEQAVPKLVDIVIDPRQYDKFAKIEEVVIDLPGCQLHC